VNLIPIPATAVLLLFGVSASAQSSEVAPLKILLLTGGCCHSYATQKEILKTGIEERIHATVDQIHVDDKSTAPPLPIYGDADYAKGYDLVIHDECAADISDPKVIKAVLAPHRKGIPGVVLHCALHSYRQAGFDKPLSNVGEPRAAWFEFAGLQTTGHGPQKPIEILYQEAKHPITIGLENWTTGDEELYNNISVLPTATSLAKGKQGKEEVMVTWVNFYTEKKVRVFGTTLGHNDVTVSDPRYLDLIARGSLWAMGKLDEEGKSLEGYGVSQ
jgi:type 1 glutamine amidotransferase